ncbi:GntR family transcriptional regulator [Rhodococcus aetherivorans]|uniref:GntR family transcriptional regulator n=1 Tax=Rhodococcus aetherivorans TaxID=191292 RepID=UPI00163B2DF1|nr:GntR family transcriptional regulator [Rhodococcus aetherivorans]MBC2592440.1 GntR family transcriptional regulator [Rhodococcus aetherivorans]
MASTKASTLAGAVYEQIRREILNGAYQPGRRLRFVDLAERYSVSQSVIREALARLSEQGLVDSLPQQGFRVVSLSLKDLNELTEARCDIESLAFRYAVERGDMEWESRVVAAHHRLASTPTIVDGEPNPEWFDVHERFHRALLEGCGNDRLLGVALSLRDASALYRHWSCPIGHDYTRDVAAEHKAILEAALVRDPEVAASLLCEHIERTTAALRPVAASQDEAS